MESPETTIIRQLLLSDNLQLQNLLITSTYITVISHNINKLNHAV